ncbi:hypothetical protein PS925_02687 [Pseudomonas fluorescens]|uniref:Uncharacterized protein n=1 Tax=Pseudomonas fluorescens TaxID=294 RepID=A0A5E7U303_PSEFL|nr:hypothetical protein [Pseudomonas fluorescens]VVQ04765.1 hypothetical protein PS925_02687 [Pseudomonas fluorescens]
MSRSQAKEYPLEFFKGSKKALQGQITVEVDGQKQTFPVIHAEVRANDIVLDFDMSGGDPDRNNIIGVVIGKAHLNKKVEFVGHGDPAYLLFQDSVQEWVATKGWIRVEWQEGSKKIAGLLDNVQGDGDNNSKLTGGKFEVTLG